MYETNYFYVDDLDYYTKVESDAKYALIGSTGSGTGTGTTVDLTPYALKTDVTTDLIPYALKTDVATDLVPYALKSDVATDLIPYALTSSIPSAVNLTPYALKTDVATDLIPYALKTDVATDLIPYALTSSIPAAQDLSQYALASNVPPLYRPVFIQTASTITMTTASLVGQLLMWNPYANATLTISYTPALNMLTAVQADINAYTAPATYLPYEIEVYNMSAFLISVVPPVSGSGNTVNTYSRYGYLNISAGGSAIIKMVQRTTTLDLGNNSYDQSLQYLIIGSLEP